MKRFIAFVVIAAACGSLWAASHTVLGDGSGATVISLTSDGSNQAVRSVIRCGSAPDYAEEGSITFPIGGNSNFEINGGENNSIIVKADSDIRFYISEGAGYTEYLRINSNGVQLTNAPTTDPHKLNAIYSDNGTLKISSGPANP